MGMTFDDINKRIYNRWREKGYSDKQIDQMVPENAKESFWASIEKTPFEAHFGSWKEILVVFAVILGITGLILFFC